MVDVNGVIEIGVEIDGRPGNEILALLCIRSAARPL